MSDTQNPGGQRLNLGVAPSGAAPAPLKRARQVPQPFGTDRQKLAYEVREGYHRYWFNDEPGRIQQAISGGYTHVVDKEGKNVCQVVDKTTGLKGYLMEIPKEWWDEDLAAVQKKVDAKEAGIRRGNVENKSAQDGDGVFYAGSGKRNISIQNR